MNVSGGVQEEGIVVGNVYDKYGSRNAVVRWVMRGFMRSLDHLVETCAPLSIHEIGCGEGHLTLRWLENGIAARGCDFSHQVIEVARRNALDRGLSPQSFQVRSIYDVDHEQDRADLIVCSEVFEHLEHPLEGLKALETIVDTFLLLSVPREPIWRGLNMARGSYLKDWGNTPGHIQHWSKASFIKLVNLRFEIVAVRNPLPWTMVLCRKR
jgi:2-polyprenyl-3-methyl-5-hydroxy-6-metoxy-1,4-benzoquinol methylase